MSQESPASNKTLATEERRWAPRIWLGFNFAGWMRLLVCNRFAVGLPYIYIAVIDTIGSVMNSGLSLLEYLLYGQKIRRTPPGPPPLFIIGHWRSGTTLLHELLVLDERHAFPTTFECFCPNNFLVSRGFLGWMLDRVMPNRRPMDNMQAGLDRPQEDEFALCLMGVPSPYLTIAFPNRPPQNEEYFNLERISPTALGRWKAKLSWFLRKVAFRAGNRRLILKSPPHTCRIKVLLDMFPGAMFVHIVRDPAAVFPSTTKLWKTLYEAHGFQTPHCNGLEEYVLGTFARMYDKLEETRGLVDPSRFVDVRYEDLVRDPISEMRRIYEHLALGEADRAQPNWVAYCESMAGYQTNKHQLAPDKAALVAQRWQRYCQRYGYTSELNVPATDSVA